MINCPALDELYEPKLQEACTKARNQGLNEGRNQGLNKGRDDLLKEQIFKKLLKNKSPEVIADELEEDDLDKIRRLIDKISKENAINVTSAS